MDANSDPSSSSLLTGATIQRTPITTLSVAEIEVDIESLERLLYSPAFKLVTLFDKNRKRDILRVITSLKSHRQWTEAQIELELASSNTTSPNVRERVSEITRVISEVSALAGVSAGALLALLKAFQALAASNPAAVQQLVKFLEAFVVK